MRTRDDRNWELIGRMLSAESSGKTPRLFSSHRTLFGIPSALDQELASIADTTDGGSSAEREETDARKKSRTFSKLERVIHPLKPVWNEESRVLILGTMPSPRSRETGFYYNHPQNRFWKVIAALFDEPVPDTNEQKERLVLSHGIALWDVLAECSIEGASDGTIAECVPNPIAEILTKAPIERIFCTGAKATELYRKYCEESTGMECVRLPSTSPANAGVSLEELIEAYGVIVPFALP